MEDGMFWIMYGASLIQLYRVHTSRTEKANIKVWPRLLAEYRCFTTVSS